MLQHRLNTFMQYSSLFPGLLIFGISSLAITSASAALLTQDFNANNGGFVMTSSGGPGGPWTYNGAGGAWFANGEGNLGTPSSSELASPAFTVTGAGNVSLAISHRYSFEFDGTRWDGGHIQYSANGGPWTQVAPGNFTFNGYNGVITGNNALTGQQGFNGDSAGYAGGAFITSEALIGNFASGVSLQVRFQAGWDEFAVGTLPNWEITSVNVVPEPASAAALAATAGLLTLRRRRRS